GCIVSEGLWFANRNRVGAVASADGFGASSTRARTRLSHERRSVMCDLQKFRNFAGASEWRGSYHEGYSTLRGRPTAPSAKREKRNPVMSSEGLPSMISSETRRPAIGPIAKP